MKIMELAKFIRFNDKKQYLELFLFKIDLLIFTFIINLLYNL